MTQQVYLMPQPTIAAINGGCADSALSIAAAADFRIASDSTVFNTDFPTAGLPGDLAGI
ncbi:enoyl-CoA hydratase [Rhodococcus opacus M213]|uniref:Enoyl-CoA hydratase n=2 Tax=Rhodococcus opacus TaxID=37919 RepID=K8XKJ9_RHOOP|nr:enoyl-CoA hydratase [Rhodococcus opacus M213]